MSTIEKNSFLLQGQVAMIKSLDKTKLNKAHSIDQARKVSEDFEAVFLSQMLQPLFKNLSAEKPFGGGSSEDMWRSMQVDEYGKAIAKAGGIGIAEPIFKEILKMQEVQ